MTCGSEGNPGRQGGVLTSYGDLVSRAVCIVSRLAQGSKRGLPHHSQPSVCKEEKT